MTVTVSSTIPAAKRDLVQRLATAFAAAEGMADVAVSYGIPASKPGEFVAIGSSEMSEDWAAIGGGRRIEDYSLHGFANTLGRPGDTQQEVTERAFALYDLVASVLRSEPTLAGTVQVAETKPTRHVEAISGEVFEAEVQFSVHCQARI